MRDRLKSVFDSTNGSGDAKDLPYNIPSIHDRIDELNTTVAQLKASKNNLEIEFLDFRRNLTSLKVSMEDSYTVFCFFTDAQVVNNIYYPV